MSDDGRTGRITAAEVARDCVAAGYPLSYRVLRAVLGGSKRSRPVLRLTVVAVRAVHSQRLRVVPDWL